MASLPYLAGILPNLDGGVSAPPPDASIQPPPGSNFGPLAGGYVDAGAPPLDGGVSAPPPAASVQPPSPTPPPEPKPSMAQMMGGPAQLRPDFNAPPPQREPGIFEPQFTAVTTSSPAREVETRGPKAQALLDKATAGGVQATDQARERSGEAYQVAKAAAFQNETDMAALADAQKGVAAQRAAEADRIAQQTKQDVDALSKMHLDPNAGRTTMDGIVGVAAVLLSMMPGAIGRGGGLALDQINKGIERNMRAQEFAYQAGIDKVKGNQTQFGMLVQKWGSEDAARSMYAASLKQAAASRMERAGLEVKGTEEQNNFMLAAEKLRDDAMKDQARALQFIQATRGTQYLMTVNGQTAPVPLTGAQALDQFNAGIKGQRDISQKGAEAGFDIIKDAAKGDTKRKEESDKGAQYISEKLQTAGVPQARTSAEAALKALNETPRGYPERIARGLKVPETALPEDTTKREGAWRSFVADTRHALTGAGMTDSERAEYDRMLANAGNDAERKAAIKRVEERLNAVEKNIKAGASPEAQAEFERRREAANAGPETPKSAKKEAW